METPSSNSLSSHIFHLERLLGRPWSDDDFSRTMERLHGVTAGNATVDAEVGLEVLHLAGGGGLAPEASDHLTAVLPKYYTILLQTWSVITDSRPPTPPPTVSDDEDDDIGEADNQDDYTLVYGPDGKVSAEDTLSMSSCKTVHYPDEDAYKTNDEDVDNCTICLDRLQRGLIAILDCGHSFHDDCIVTWVIRGRNFCPLCKAKALR